MKSWYCFLGFFFFSGVIFDIYSFHLVRNLPVSFQLECIKVLLAKQKSTTVAVFSSQGR